MKNNQEIIEEFRKEFVQENGPDIEDSIIDPVGSAGPIVQFFKEALQAKDTQHKQTMVELVESFDEDWWEHPIEWKNEQLNQLKG